jgi:hypothetical protein
VTIPCDSRVSTRPEREGVSSCSSKICHQTRRRLFHERFLCEAMVEAAEEGQERRVRPRAEGRFEVSQVACAGVNFSF